MVSCWCRGQKPLHQHLENPDKPVLHAASACFRKAYVPDAQKPLPAAPVRPKAWSLSAEQKVLTLRFGLEDGRARTLEEVGREFNVTRERIRQIEAKALRKLRAAAKIYALSLYLTGVPAPVP